MSIAETNFTMQADWLAARLNGICSSEAAAILGWSKFSSPWAVWSHKTRKVERIQGSDTEMQEWGHRHEPALEAKFADVTGRAVENPGEYFMCWQGMHGTTIDRWQYERGEQGVLELKCAWFDAFTEWQTRVPVAYQIQIQHQLFVTGCQFASIAVLGNGYQFKYFHITRSESFINKMVERLNRWWETYVIADVPPPADGNPATAEAIARVYPQAKSERVDLCGEEWWERHQDRERLAAEIKEREGRLDEINNLLKAGIGSAEFGVLPDGTGYSYKNTAKGRRLLRVDKQCQRD